MTATYTPAAHSATFARGIHPREWKHLAAEVAIEVLPPPKEVRIPLLQHLGAPCEPTRKPRTEVGLGDVVGEPKATKERIFVGSLIRQERANPKRSRLTRMPVL